MLWAKSFFTAAAADNDLRSIKIQFRRAYATSSTLFSSPSTPTTSSITTSTTTSWWNNFYPEQQTETFLICSSSNKLELYEQIRVRAHILHWIPYHQCQIQSNFFSNVYIVTDSNPGNNSSIIHQYCYCDWCMEQGKHEEIIGLRYHCLQCPGFDSCESCYHLHQNTVCNIPDHSYCIYPFPLLSVSQLVTKSYADSLVNILLNYDSLPCLGIIDPSISTEAYQWMSYREIYQRCLKFGSYMRKIQITSQEIIIICSSNCPDYMVCDLTCGIYGYILVPISCHASFADFEEIYSLLEGRCQTVIFSQETFHKYFSFVKERLTSIIHFIVINSADFHDSTTQVVSLNHILLSNVTLSYPQPIAPSALVTISFTSGTSTGIPKGLPITCEQRLNLLLYYCKQTEISRVPKEIGLIFTHLNYTASREEILFLLVAGGQAGIYPAGSLESTTPSLYEHIEILQPTFFAAIPSFWCELYNSYQSEYDHLIDPQDRVLLHSKYYNIFGHRCIALSTGSAHTPTHVYQFMKDILTRAPIEIGMPRLIYEGYGTMECGGISNNGKFLDSVSWKISTEGGIVDKFSGETLVGELFVRTSRMVGEYYNNYELTHDRYTPDGYFKTGDLVQLTCHCGSSNPQQCCCDTLGGPHITVIGRTASVMKLSNGEYFSPEVVEGILLKCASILDLFVYLKPSYGYPIAIVVIAPECCRSDMETVEEGIFNEIMELGLQEHLPHCYLPQGIVITSNVFTVEENLLTSSGKKCRSKIYAKYQIQIQGVYEKIEKQKKLQFLIRIFEDVLQSSTPLDASSNIWKRGLDSLGVAFVVHQISTLPALSNIPLELCKQYLLNSDTVSSFMNLAERYSEPSLRGGSNLVSQTPSVHEHWKECALEDLNWELPTPDRSIVEDSCLPTPKHIFLFGFTGFIGSSIFSSIINSDLAIESITVLLRSKSQGDIYQRFISILLSLCHPTWTTEDEILDSFSTIHILSSSPRIISQHTSSQKLTLYLLEGDLSENNFQLHDDAAFKMLLSRITHCIYAAGQTSFLSSYLQMRPSNVLAIHNFLLFLSQCTKRISLIFLSSLSASFHPSLPSFRSIEFDHSEYYQSIVKLIDSCSDESSMTIGYPLSKMIAEYLISSYCHRFGVPYISLQLGTISCNMETGYSNLTDLTTRLIHSLILHTTLPLVDERDKLGSIDLLPVNCVTEVVKKILLSDVYNSQVIPIYTSTPIAFSRIISQTLSYTTSTSDSANYQYLPLQKWLEQLSSSDPLYPLVPLLCDLLLSPYHPPTSSSLENFSNQYICLDLGVEQIYISADLLVFDVDSMISRIVKWLRGKG